MNIIVMKHANIFNIKIIYLMHLCVSNVKNNFMEIVYYRLKIQHVLDKINVIQIVHQV